MTVRKALPVPFRAPLPPDRARSTVVIVVTAYGDVESAVSALKAGAADYLTKPIQLPDLIIKLRKVIEARGLRKKFGDFEAVRGIDVAVRRGEAFGFLGPNGAGKSSTMRMIACVSPRSDGSSPPCSWPWPWPSANVRRSLSGSRTGWRPLGPAEYGGAANFRSHPSRCVPFTGCTGPELSPA